MQTGIEMRCPKCHSAKVNVHKNGAAPSVADHISLLEGAIDNTAIMLICQQCGSVFPPSEAKMAQHLDYEQTTPTFATATVQPDEQQVHSICRDQGNLAAVKYIHDTYGWGLKEAKEFVDRILQHTSYVSTAPAQPRDEERIIRIVQEQGKLNAIKYCKDNYNLGLKEAKDYVEGIMSGRGITPAAGKTGCFIATACYGDYDAPEVKVLRLYRDQVMAGSRIGRTTIRLYYALSPGLAAAIRRSPRAQHFSRTYILNALVQRIASAIK